MAEELNINTALELARSLKTVSGFPWDDATIKATAEDLIRWCKGSDTWAPELQALWLVTQARENWTEWKGTAGLRALFRDRFGDAGAVRPANLAVDYSAAPCICGSNKKFRDCCEGKPLDFGPLDRLRKRESVPVAEFPSVRRIEQADVDRALEEYRKGKTGGTLQ